MKKVVLSLLVVFVSLGSFAQKVQVPAGTKLQTTIVSTIKMGMDVMGNTMDNAFTTTNLSDVEAKSADKTGYTFLNTLKKVTMKVSVMGQESEFDSDKPGDLDSEVGKAFKGKINHTDTFRVSPAGRIESAPGSSAEAGVEMTDMNQMMSQFTIGQPYPLLPAFPAGVTPKQGDTWSDSTGSPETVKMVTAYKLESVSGDDFTISFNSVMTKKGTMEQQGMQLEMDMTGPMNGSSVFDKKTGLLKTNNTTMDIKGHMAVAGQEIDFNLTGTLKTEVTKQ